MILKNGVEQASQNSWFVNNRWRLRTCKEFSHNKISINCFRLSERLTLATSAVRLGFFVIGHSSSRCGPNGWANYCEWTVPRSWTLFRPMLETEPLSRIISFRCINTLQLSGYLSDAVGFYVNVFGTRENKVINILFLYCFDTVKVTGKFPYLPKL